MGAARTSALFVLSLIASQAAGDLKLVDPVTRPDGQISFTILEGRRRARCVRWERGDVRGRSIARSRTSPART